MNPRLASTAQKGASFARRAVRTFRPVYLQAIERSPTLRLVMHLSVGQIERSTAFVEEGYRKVWSDFHAHLDRCSAIDEWLFIPGVEDVPRGYRIENELRYQPFNFGHHVVDTLLETMRDHFPDARSITEYGCGVGRNMLELKRRRPELTCYGYELAAPGVEVAERAAKKFGIDVKYAALDYIHDGPEKYVHPKTDLALTVYSLEQVPREHGLALKNMLGRSHMGSIHFEPVAENYPRSYGGALGRLYSKKTDYLRGFDETVRSLGLPKTHVRVLPTSHNPLIFPSLYVLEKRAF